MSFQSRWPKWVLVFGVQGKRARQWPDLPGKGWRNLIYVFLVANTKHSPDFIGMNGNFLNDFSENKTGPDSMPSSPGVLFALILFRKLWGGDLGAESPTWGLSWESVSGGLVSLPSLALWQAGMSICSLENHFHWQGNDTSMSLSLSCESLGNTLEPLWRALLLKLSFFTPEKVTEIQLCICVLTFLIQSVVSLLSSSTMDSHPASSGHRAWEGIEVAAVWQVLRDTFSFRLIAVCGIDSVWDVIGKGKPRCFESQ